MEASHPHVSILLERREAGTPAYSENGMSGLGSVRSELVGVRLGPVLGHGVSGLGDVYVEMFVGRLKR